MASFRPTLIFRNAAALFVLLALGACAGGPRLGSMSEHECMTRVMYFESNRSSEEGMIAVGTVVMNRVESERYPNTVCAVVSQTNQFAPGLMTKPMEAGRDLASQAATKVLNGRLRHRKVASAMFFHTSGMTFPYTNMHYLVEAGGNVFYEKRKNARRLSDPPFRNPGAMLVVPSGSPQMKLLHELPGRPVEPMTRDMATASAAPAFKSPALPAALPVRSRPTSQPKNFDPLTIDDLIAKSGG